MLVKAGIRTRTVSEPCCPTHYAMGTIGNFDKCQWNLKIMWHDRDMNPDLPLQNPVVLPTVPWKQMEVLTNVNEIMKIYGPTETQTRT